MPYHVGKPASCPASRPWGVVKDSDGEVMGCHATEGEANDQLAALYANEANKETLMPGRTKADDYTQLPDFERKVVPVSGVKVVDEAKGIVEAFVSVIGNVDSGGDVIGEKFFSSSLDTHLKKNPKGVYAHDWSRPVSKLVETRTVAPGSSELPTEIKVAGHGAQYVRMQYNLKTQSGRDAYEEVVFFGPEQEWSIGYVPIGAYVDEKTGARHLPESKWFEWSQVLFGMNPLTATVGVKAMAERTGVGYDEALSTLRKIVLGGGEKSERALEALRDLAVEQAAIEAEPLEVRGEPVTTSRVEVKVGEPEVEAKQLDIAGSFEEAIGRVSAAVAAWARETYPPETGQEQEIYAWTVATWPDHVVACVTDFMAGERSFYDFPYVVGDDGAVTLGAGREVELVTSIVPKVWAAELAAVKDAKVGARHSASDLGMLQSIHDQAVSLGADCPGAEEGKGEPAGPVFKVTLADTRQAAGTAGSFGRTAAVVDTASMENELAALELSLR